MNNIFTYTWSITGFIYTHVRLYLVSWPSHIHLYEYYKQTNMRFKLLDLFLEEQTCKQLKYMNIYYFKAMDITTWNEE
jgi:hypothetical protein